MRCERCGKDYNAELNTCPFCGASAEYAGKTMFFTRAKISKIGFKDIFSDTFKKHLEGTAARTFAAGSPTTTPTPDRMLAEWQKPWLYLRILIIGVLFAFVSYALSFTLNPGMVMVTWSFGSLVIPWAVLIFVWEMNIPRDISLVKVLVVFFVGGILSILATSLLNEVAYSTQTSFAAFIEEPAKLIITLIFIHRFKVKYGFGGLLVGCAVGVGFAVFENIAYVFNSFSSSGISTGTSVFIARALSSVGSHGIWASLYGGAAALARSGKSTGFSYLKKPLTYISFLCSVLLHFIWNGGLGKITYFYIGGVIIIGYIFFGYLIKKCVKQVVEVHEEPRIIGYAGGSGEAGLQSNRENSDVYEDRITGFVIKSSLLPNSEFELEKVVMIGRDAKNCDLVIPAKYSRISRRHSAVCVSDDGIAYVMDMGSSNGTFLKNKKRIQPSNWVPVDEGFYLVTEDISFQVKPIINKVRVTEREEKL